MERSGEYSPAAEGDNIRCKAATSRANGRGAPAPCGGPPGSFKQDDRACPVFFKFGKNKMLRAFSKGISQLNDRATRKVLWLSMGSALAAFTALLWIVGYLLTATVLFTAGWLETVVDLLAGSKCAFIVP